MKLTMQTDYAFRVLMYLQDRPDKNIQTKEISEFYDISKNHLVKVINRLTNLGYLQSTRGRYGGGVQMIIPPEKINVGKLVSEMESNMDIVECFCVEKNTCNITPKCSLIAILAEAKQELIKSLKKYNLKNLKNSTIFKTGKVSIKPQSKNKRMSKKDKNVNRCL